MAAFYLAVGIFAVLFVAIGLWAAANFRHIEWVRDYAIYLIGVPVLALMAVSYRTGLEFYYRCVVRQAVERLRTRTRPREEA